MCIESISSSSLSPTTNTLSLIPNKETDKKHKFQSLHSNIPSALHSYIFAFLSMDGWTSVRQTCHTFHTFTAYIRWFQNINSLDYQFFEKYIISCDKSSINKHLNLIDRISAACPNLISIQISQKISLDDCKGLINNFPKLKHINLETQIEDKSIAIFEKLESVHLRIVHSSAKSIVFLPRLPNLKSLELVSDCYTSEDRIIVTKALSECTQLEKLAFSQIKGITPDDIEHVINSLSNLKSISVINSCTIGENILNGCARLKKLQSIIFQQAPYKSSPPRAVRTIPLSKGQAFKTWQHPPLKAQAFELLSTNSSLKKLELRGITELRDSHLQQIATIPSLTHLTLCESNHLTITGYDALIRCTTLQFLKLITLPKADLPSPIQSISSLITNCPNLREIDLTERSVTDKEVCQLMILQMNFRDVSIKLPSSVVSFEHSLSLTKGTSPHQLEKSHSTSRLLSLKPKGPSSRRSLSFSS